MMWFDNGFMGIFAWLFMVSFWVGVIVLVVWAVRSLSTPKGGGQDEAIALLERRFAAGEIEREEFEERRRVLRGG